MTQNEKAGWLAAGCAAASLWAVVLFPEIIGILVDLVPDPQPQGPMDPFPAEPPDFDWDKESPGPDDIDPYIGMVPMR